MILEINLSTKQTKRVSPNPKIKDSVISNRGLMIVLDLDNSQLPKVLRYFGFSDPTDNEPFTFNRCNMYVINEQRSVFSDVLVYMVDLEYLESSYIEFADFILRQVSHVVLIANENSLGRLNADFLELGPADHLYNFYLLVAEHRGSVKNGTPLTSVFKENPRVSYFLDLAFRCNDSSVVTNERLEWLINSIEVDLMKRDSANMVVQALYFNYLEIVWDHHCIAYLNQQADNINDYNSHNAYIYNCLMTTFCTTLQQTFMAEVGVLYMQVLKRKNLEAAQRFMEQANKYIKDLKRVYGKLTHFEELERFFKHYLDKIVRRFIQDKIAGFKETFADAILKLIEKNVVLGVSSELSIDKEVEARFQVIDAEISLIPLRNFESSKADVELWKSWQASCYKVLYFESLRQNLEQKFLKAQMCTLKTIMKVDVFNSSEPLWKFVHVILNKFEEEFNSHFYEIKRITGTSEEEYQNLKECVLGTLMAALRSKTSSFISLNLPKLISKLTDKKDDPNVITEFLQNLNVLVYYDRLEVKHPTLQRQDTSVFTEGEFKAISDKAIKHYVKEKSEKEKRAEILKAKSYKAVSQVVAALMKKQFENRIKTHIYYDLRTMVLLGLIVLTIAYLLYK